MNLTWINGEYIEDSKACLHVSDLAIQRGYGVFDFFRLRQPNPNPISNTSKKRPMAPVPCKPFLLAHYLDRFYNSAQELNLEVPLDRNELTQAMYQFIERNQLADHGIKLVLTGGYAEDYYTPLEPNLIIQAHQIKLPPQAKYQEGSRIMTFEYQRELPTVKSINYLQGIQLIPELLEKDLDDVLYYKDGVISEFPRSNIFIVDYHNRLVTPANNILPGITRKTVLHLARDHYEVEVRDVFVEELLAAKEAFLTSTTKAIMPIREVDGQLVGEGVPGTATKYLAKLLDELPADFELVDS